MWKIGLITIVRSGWLVGEWLTGFYMLAGMACVSILKHISTVTLYISIIRQNITVCRSYTYFSSKSKILKDTSIMHFPLVFLNSLYRQNSHLFICPTCLYAYVLVFSLAHKVMDFIVVFSHIYFIFIRYGPSLFSFPTLVGFLPFPEEISLRLHVSSFTLTFPNLSSSRFSSPFMVPYCFHHTHSYWPTPLGKCTDNSAHTYTSMYATVFLFVW